MSESKPQNLPASAHSPETGRGAEMATARPPAANQHSIRAEVGLRAWKTLLAEPSSERVMAIVEDPSLLDFVGDLVEQLEAAQSALREIGRTYDGVTPIFRKTGPKMLGAAAFTYAPDICEALNVARRWPVTYPAISPPVNTAADQSGVGGFPGHPYPATEASEEETTAGSDGTDSGTPDDGSAERLSRPATSSSEASDPAKERS